MLDLLHLSYLYESQTPLMINGVGVIGVGVDEGGERGAGRVVAGRVAREEYNKWSVR